MFNTNYTELSIILFSVNLILSRIWASLSVCLTLHIFYLGASMRKYSVHVPDSYVTASWLLHSFFPKGNTLFIQ